MQGTPLDFRLYPSNDLDVLAALLADRLRVPGGDWWQEDTVLVPQFSMRRWLQQALAGHLGICANVRLLTPGEFVDLALDANLPAAARGDRLAPEVLRWHLLRELEQDPPPGLDGFVAQADPRRRWTLAGSLADSFEKYQAWRRELLLQWERRAPADDAQAQLWRRIAGGRAHRARRIGEYLRRFGREGGAPAGLPPRLFVFACQNVSPDVLQVIASQARAGEQHFFLHTPARAYWGDLQRWAADYRPAEDDRFGGDNPLLASWGQAGRDFIAALGDGETVRARFESAAFTEPAQGELLGRMQADLLDNRAPLQDAPADSPWPRAAVDRADPSLQFHACHTRLREVQVLHDQLRALLDRPAEPGRGRIEPRDIAVLMPDVDAYAPHVEAVFGGALGTPRELPYTVADTSPLATAALAAAFLRLLRLPLQPLTLPDVADLLAVPALAQRFGLEDADRARLQDWLQAAGARWGLDGEDRARHGAGDDAAYTFQFALDRLLLGLASGADDLIAGVAPWPELEGQATEALDGLVRLLGVLRQFGARMQGELAPAGWSQLLAEMVAAVFAAEPREPAERAVLERLHQALAGFAESAGLAGYAQPLAHAVVLDHFQDELSRSEARAPFLSGGICFGRMVPMRLIPFRVICLLGMEEAAFPARDGRDPVNRINQALDTPQRRVGDPSRRDGDRYLFLQLFASASRVFYLSWVGMDARDGSRREPSMLVSELLDAAARYHRAEPASIAAQLVVRHALQPFSAGAFGAALADEAQPDARRFSYDARWQPAAAVTGGDAQQAAFATRLPARPATPTLALARLRNALMRPHAFYLQDGLGLRLPEDEPPLRDHEPFGPPDPLTRHGLRQIVFQHWRLHGRRPPLPALRRELLARGWLPPGADGEAALDGVAHEVAAAAEAALEAGFAGADQMRPFELDLGGGRMLIGTLDQGYPHGLLRAVLNPSGRHGGHALRHGLDWLVACALSLPLHELAAEKKDEAPRWRARPAVSPARAREALDALWTLHERAARLPLSFLPKSSYAWWSLLQRAADPDEALQQKALDEACKRWQGGEGNSGEPAEAQAATRLALRGRDPFLDDDADALEAFERTAHAVFAAVELGQPFDAEALP